MASRRKFEASRISRQEYFFRFGKRPFPSEEVAAKVAFLQSRYYSWRTPNGDGPKSVDMIFEIMPCVYTLLRDLDLKTARKGGWRELLEFYGVGDYEGIVQEWLNRAEVGSARA